MTKRHYREPLGPRGAERLLRSKRSPAGATHSQRKRALTRACHTMGAAMPRSATQETIDWVAIRRLHSRYADVVNRRAWPELSDLFLPDAVVRVEVPRQEPVDAVGPAALGAFIEGAVERFEFF